MNAPNLRIVAVPCFSGAPWRLERFPIFANEFGATSPALPEAAESVETAADAVLAEVERHASVVLVGDSFGALVSIAVAARRPSVLVGLVLSGGFAADPNRSMVGKVRAWFARTLPRSVYRTITLRAHAAALASPVDAEVPWSTRHSRDLFLQHTPWESYVARLRAILTADFRSRLCDIEVPTLILTPSFDKLVGPVATRELSSGIRHSEECVLHETGHMFRFTHPRRYEEAVVDFVRRRVQRSPSRSS
jgi:pimeloyl-ACP methyl ester carboxylesterase